ncbi:dynein regulatory complex protein 9-like [Aulostomus maculatus]
MSLSRTQSLRLAAVLEECSNQLDIVGHSLTVQMGGECAIARPELQRAPMTKLQLDGQYISQLVAKLVSELERKQSFTCLQQVLEAEDKRKRDENILKEDKAERDRRKQTLQRQQEKLQQQNEKLTEIQQVVKDLRHQLSERPTKAEKKKLADLNTAMQVRKTQIETSQAEKQLEHQLEKLREQLKHELRVHEESQTFLLIRHEELLQQLQEWRRCTQEMLQEKKQQLHTAVCKRTENSNSLVEMQRTMAGMEEVMIEDMLEKKEREEESRAALHIQAWCRGFLARKVFRLRKEEEEKKAKKTTGGKKKKQKKKK